MANIIKRINFNPIGGATNAQAVSYDNTDSGLVGDTVQEAIDETVVLARDAQDSADQAQSEVDTLELSVADINTRLTTAEGEIDALQAADIALDARLDTAEAEINTLQSDLDAVESDVATLQTDLAGIDTRLTTAEGEINTLQTDVVTAQNTANTAQTTANTAITNAATAQSAANTAQDTINNHISDTTDAHDASAISNIPAGTISSTNIQDTVNELDSAIVDAQADASQALSDAAAAQADANQAQSEVDALELLVSTNTGAIAALDTRIDAIEPYISAGDISEKSYSFTNNTVSPTNITGFAFTDRGFTAQVSVEVIATSSLYQNVQIHGTKNGSTWVISYSGTGDNSLVGFDITSGGQVTYTCPSYPGFVSGHFYFRAITTG